jgi:hypothetical protein
MLPVAATAACGGPNLLAPPPGPTPSVRTLRASITAEQSLVDAYHRVLAAYPAMTAMLRPFLSHHDEHLTQLKSRLIIPPHVKATPLPSPSAAARPPASARAAVTMLGEAERAAAAAQMGRLAAATPSLAQLLASIAASEATHAVALSALNPAGG